jgi:hypothetical protein
MSRRFLFLAVFVFVFSVPASAQFTTVTATVKDSNGIPYAGAVLNAILVPSTGGGYTLSGQPYSGRIGPVTLDSAGKFTVNFGDVTLISPGSPQWQITIDSAAATIAGPLGTGPQSFTYTSTGTTISGSTPVSLTTALNALAPQLTNITLGSGSVTSVAASSPIVVTPSPIIATGTISCPTCSTNIPGINGPPTTGLMARYDIPAGDNPAALIDTSGNGNNGTGTDGTAPTVAAITGGLVCVGSGASKLPAVLNSALTIAVYMRINPPMLAQNEAPVLGNGNGSPSHAIGIILRQGELTTGNGNQVRSFGNGAFDAQTTQGFYGTGLLTLTMSTVDHFYFGVSEGGYNTSITLSPSAGLQTTGFYQLCGNAAGSGAGSVTRFTGTIYNAYFYDHVLNSTELSQLSNWITNSNSSRGVPSTLVTNASGNQIVTVGDSLTSTTSGITAPWPTALTLNNGPWTINVPAQDGEEMFENITAQPQIADFFFVPAGQNNLLTDWLCTNDIALASRTPAQCLQDSANFLRPRRQLGWKVLVASMIDRNGFTSQKDTMDNLWLNNWNQMADGFVDVASDASLGADAANANSVFFQTGGVHLNQAPEYSDVTYMFQHAINAAYGNTTWPTATTYTTGAVAPVATTALTESGNTVTVTFAATPANCQVGNLLTIAGVTSSGYNSTTANGSGLGGWLILTRSATQITYYDNTTGLSNASVQGTGVCAQEQDADVFAVLGGTAVGPNHTLQPCEGRSGQPIYRMITNTNATSWTISGFNNETINGGSAFTTPVASGTNHPVVQLKPIPNAYATGGCTWQASLQ